MPILFVPHYCVDNVLRMWNWYKNIFTQTFPTLIHEKWENVV